MTDASIDTGLNRCAFCHDGVDVEERAVCATCLAIHHLACWEEHGSCAACRETRVLTATARSAPEPAEGGKSVADLAAALADDDVLRRRVSAYALSKRGLEAASVAGALEEALADEDAWVRRWAAVALGGAGPKAAGAADALARAAEDDVGHVRRAASEALERVREGG